MSSMIANCIFGYKCDQSWDALADTDDSNVKYCKHCKNNVFYCSTPEELMRAIRRRVCVSVDKLESGKKIRLLGVPDGGSIPKFFGDD